MSEGPSFNSPETNTDQKPDLSCDIAYIGVDIVTPQGTPPVPETSASIFGDYDPLSQIQSVKLEEDIPTESLQTEGEKDASTHQSYKTFGCQSAPPYEPSINPSFLEFTTINEWGMVELDIDKMERKFWTLNLDETTEDEPCQEDRNVELLRDRIISFFKVSEEPEISSQLTEQEESFNTENERTENLTEQTEQQESSGSENKGAEKLTEFKYEKKNKLWNRKPHLRLMCKEFCRSKFGNTEFTEEALDIFSEHFLNNFESHLHPAVNILRRIAYPKLCEKHFSPDFPYGAFAEENNSDAKYFSISMDHFEFSHKELLLNFLELFQREDFDSIAIDWEKNPEINNFLPTFGKFLESDGKFECPQKCLILILAILKNPYRKFEFFYDDKLPVVKEQTAIAEYLVTCLQCPLILADTVYREKLAETIISFANIHKFFLAKILAGFTTILSIPKEKLLSEEHAYQIYCQVLSIMNSIGATIIPLCLPQHFSSISCLAANDQNCELYFHLLKACEILIADAIENESQIVTESSDPKEKDPNEKDLNSFYSDCHNYFGYALTNRLIPVFRKYEMRKNREERYLYKKHSIYPSKFGYMDTEMQFLFNKYTEESESSNLPRVKECTFNSTGKVLCSLNTQLGYINQEEMFELSGDDVEYWNSIQNFPVSDLEGVNKIISKNN